MGTIKNPKVTDLRFNDRLIVTETLYVGTEEGSLLPGDHVVYTHIITDKLFGITTTRTRQLNTFIAIELKTATLKDHFELNFEGPIFTPLPELMKLEQGAQLKALNEQAGWNKGDMVIFEGWDYYFQTFSVSRRNLLESVKVYGSMFDACFKRPAQFMSHPLNNMGFDDEEFKRQQDELLKKAFT